MRYCVVATLALVARAALAGPSPEAEQLYRDGQASYDQARYDEALVAWRRSYDLSQAPGLLYNIAQALRLRGQPGDCALARAEYQRFVAAVDQSPQQALALSYIDQLASCASAPTKPTTAPVASDHASNVRSIIVIAGGVAGLAVLGTGIGLGHHASTLGDDVTAACAISCDWATEQGRDAAGRRDAALGWTFGALGVAALVGSAAFYYFGVGETNVGVAAPATQPRDRGAVIMWSRVW